jgi:hypothetical protein
MAIDEERISHDRARPKKPRRLWPAGDVIQVGGYETAVGYSRTESDDQDRITEEALGFLAVELPKLEALLDDANAQASDRDLWHRYHEEVFRRQPTDASQPPSGPTDSS